MYDSSTPSIAELIVLCTIITGVLVFVIAAIGYALFSAATYIERVSHHYDDFQ